MKLHKCLEDLDVKLIPGEEKGHIIYFKLATFLKIDRKKTNGTHEMSFANALQ